jgi:hypothetical protein
VQRDVLVTAAKLELCKLARLERRIRSGKVIWKLREAVGCVGAMQAQGDGGSGIGRRGSGTVRILGSLEGSGCQMV